MTYQTNTDHQTPREILGSFYEENNLDPDGGQGSSSVKMQLTPKFHFYFPNFDARRNAVIRHDIHHLVSGYETTVSGESEISAWEIASGCKSYWAAFLIDTSGVMLGLAVNFLGVLKAFARGRRTKNLYHDVFSLDTALDMKIGELRRELLLDQHHQDCKPTFMDVVLLLGFAFFGMIYSILALVLLPFILLYTVYTEVRIRSAVS